MTTLRLGNTGAAVRSLQERLNDQGFPLAVDGIFGRDTEATVKWFQAAHLGPNGSPLVADGVVGPATQWALDKPSGKVQSEGRDLQPSGGLTIKRVQLLGLIDREHRLGVREIPDGSNSGPEVDKYFAGTGVRAQPWCCAFVTWALSRIQPVFRTLSVHKLWAEAKVDTPERGRRVRKPVPGDVFVQLFEGGKGHTGFVIGVSLDDEWIYTAEGNAGNRLKYGKRHVSTVDGFIDFFQDGQGFDFQRGSDRTVEALDGRTR